MNAEHTDAGQVARVVAVLHARGATLHAPECAIWDHQDEDSCSCSLFDDIEAALSTAPAQRDEPPCTCTHSHPDSPTAVHASFCPHGAEPWRATGGDSDA